MNQSLSPSLVEGARSAHEIKFLIDLDQADRALDWARSNLSPDPHGDASNGGSYSISTLYLDTDELDVLNRTPGFKTRKFRVRRYADEPTVYLEQKTKRGSRVSKLRTALPESELASLAIPLSLEDWNGTWFLQRVAKKQLQPTAVVSYDRTAFFGSSLSSPVRMTMDQYVRAKLCTDWRVDPVFGGKLVLGNQRILELKFEQQLPKIFRELIFQLKLEVCAVSKYRLAKDRNDEFGGLSCLSG